MTPINLTRVTLNLTRVREMNDILPFDAIFANTKDNDEARLFVRNDLRVGEWYWTSQYESPYPESDLRNVHTFTIGEME